MSFSQNVKDEICKSSTLNECCSTAELYGFLLFSNHFDIDEIKVSIENTNVIERVSLLFRKVFGINPIILSTGSKTIISITEKAHLKLIFNEFGYDFKPFVSLHINRNILNDSCCNMAFIKGVFLACGSITNPNKHYHLEIKTLHSKLSAETISIMLDLNIKPKITKRKNISVIYMKDSTDIEDFLTLICAPVSSLNIMETKVEKELINNVNRKVNCETANLGRLVEASMKQIDIISKAIDKYGIEFFPENLHQTINLRLDNPQLSLAELAKLSDDGLSKAGINHRLRKIISLAQGG